VRAARWRLAALLSASLQRAAAEVAAIDARPETFKRLGAGAMKERLQQLLDEVAQLAGFATFAMAAEAPTAAELQRCVEGARRQTAAQLEALVGGLAARLGGLEEGQRRIASGVELLVSKKQDVHTKEAALEQNRIDPADVERTGEVIGRGAYGIAGSL